MALYRSPEGQDCFAQFKYITMTSVYVVLVLWNIIL